MNVADFNRIFHQMNWVGTKPKEPVVQQNEPDEEIVIPETSVSDLLYVLFIREDDGRAALRRGEELDLETPVAEGEVCNPAAVGAQIDGALPRIPPADDPVCAQAKLTLSVRGDDEDSRTCLWAEVVNSLSIGGK